MRLPSTKVILFNAGAIVVAGAAIFGAAHSMFTASATPPCGERYLKMTSFSLDRGGVILTSADLQAMSGGRDAGVMQNVAIVRKDGPAPLAVEVNLQKGSSGREDGMAFPWEPRALAGKTAACLSYHVFLPRDFDFRRSGKLPGLTGGSEQDGFAVPVTWDASGRTGAFVRAASGPGVMALAEVKLPKGRWAKVEQEVILNAPRAGNGVLRLWVDGALAIERKDVRYRAGDEAGLSAVAAEVHYTGPAVAADKAAKLWLSPFEVRWQ